MKDASENASGTSEFKTKSTWNPQKGASALELFLSQTKDILSMLTGKATNYNVSKEVHLTIRSLQNDRDVVIKSAGKGSAMIVWDRNDYFKES